MANSRSTGVESICTQLTELGVPIAPSTYYDHINREPSRRELRDGELKEHRDGPVFLDSGLSGGCFDDG
ncbi:hypothetical protein [Mycobacterium canetti]|uniref:hypothetical protein n=1 Tax=Mycobacterium canetti TaxID=78331 RepID=UPI001E4F4072|nr:hypothetical protein [Mycobacterium canetti]